MLVSLNNGGKRDNISFLLCTNILVSTMHDTDMQTTCNKTYCVKRPLLKKGVNASGFTVLKQVDRRVRG